MPRPRTVDDEQILIAAARAVGEVGPQHMTLADVGTRVGLSPATLLQRFGSKRGLLLALASHGAEHMPARIQAAADADDPLTALMAVMDDFASSVASVKEFANHLTFLLMDLSDPDFQSISQRYAEAVQSAIADVLAKAVEGGSLSGDADVPRLAGLVLVAYNGALVTWGMNPRGRAQDAVQVALDAALASSVTRR